MNTPSIRVFRDEVPADADAIRTLIQHAFRDAAHRSGTEPFIVDALRRDGALSTSVVALHDGVIVGHAATSPITIDGHDLGWHGIGPVSVSPPCQRAGIGKQLVTEVLGRLRTQGAAGCVVLGDPGYYRQLGFRMPSRLRLPGVPAKYFQALPFDEGVPQGDVA